MAGAKSGYLVVYGRKGMKGNYGSSAKGNFKVIDTIGVPHPYCITPRHVAVASDHHMGRLGKAAIFDAEIKGAKCGVKNCDLPFEFHEEALLVACYENIKGNKELENYLLKIKAEAEKNNYAGFAFLDKR